MFEFDVKVKRKRRGYGEEGGWSRKHSHRVCHCYYNGVIVLRSFPLSARSRFLSAIPFPWLNHHPLANPTRVERTEPADGRGSVTSWARGIDPRTATQECGLWMLPPSSEPEGNSPHTMYASLLPPFQKILFFFLMLIPSTSSSSSSSFTYSYNPYSLFEFFLLDNPSQLFTSAKNQKTKKRNTHRYLK